MSLVWGIWYRKFRKISCPYQRECVYERVITQGHEPRVLADIVSAYDAIEQQEDAGDSYWLYSHQIHLQRGIRIAFSDVLMGRMNEWVKEVENGLESLTGAMGDMPFQVERGVPQRIIKVALEKYSDYQKGRARTRLTKKHKHRVIDLPSHYRLLIKQGKVLCISHQTYNKEVERV